MPPLEENPFVFGTIASGQYFAGIKDELAELVSDLAGPAHCPSEMIFI